MQHNFLFSGQAFKVGQSSTPTSSTPSPAMVVTLTSQFNPKTGDMFHCVKDDSAPSSSVHEATCQPSTTFGELIVPEIPGFRGNWPKGFPNFFSGQPTCSFQSGCSDRVSFQSPRVSGEGSGDSHPPSTSKVDPPQPSRATTPPSPLSKAPSSTQASSEGLGKFPWFATCKAVFPETPKNTVAATSLTFGPLPSISSKATSTAATSGGAGVMPLPLASIPSMASLLELVREFGQIQTKLRSPSLKGLQDVEKALTKLHQAQQLSKVQYESFLNFFDNLRALRDQHQQVERGSNRLKCYEEKHINKLTKISRMSK
ncbi:TMV resistance protein N-like [Pyrus ussuriensis x Pyrus communis]|uniref:TMV resistance protein N-like n=1 Tax=Pyrus ussuriensis x Pyrus communis TaxID=2448454 RepID=A0A5N5GS06_9ROSA|nr:TMV resistance protein N-like [Pyrus ussuriensis x Pyrus communis]